MKPEEQAPETTVEETQQEGIKIQVVTDEMREQADNFMTVLEQDIELQNRFGIMIASNETIMQILVSNTLRCLQGIGEMAMNARQKGSYQLKVTPEAPEEGIYYIVVIDSAAGAGESKFRIEAVSEGTEDQWEDVTEHFADGPAIPHIDKQIADLGVELNDGDQLYLQVLHVEDQMLIDGKNVDGEEVVAGKPSDEEE